MSLVTGTLTVQTVEGDATGTDRECVIEKVTAPGAVGDRVVVAEAAQFGYTFVSFTPGNTFPIATVEEIVGDPDTDHVVLAVDESAAPSLVVGQTYDTIKLGEALVALVPGA